MLKKLALLVALACGPVTAQNVAGTTALEPGVIYNTSNLVQPTISGSNSTPWTNSVYQGQLTCFGGTDPGYCGPNSIATPGYNLNFSYGMTDTFQQISVAAALPNSGTGLRVNGYNFSFMAKNGNGWDNGQTDVLYAYVQFSDPTGKTVLNHTRDLNYQFNWTQFNYNETLATPFATKDLGTVKYGFIGYDTNYWAGPYGPEVTAISFSLKYSVDPCATNPLYSPTCPGYMDALAKLMPTTTATTTATTVSEPVVTTSPTTTTTAQPTAVATVVSAPAPTVTATTTTTAAAASSQSSKEAAAPNTSLALSIIGKNSERDSAALSVAQTATAQAAAAAQQSQQEAASVASSAVSNSLAANAVTIGGQQTNGNGIKINANAAGPALGLSGPANIPGAATMVAMLGPQTQSTTSLASTVTAPMEQPIQQITASPVANATTATVQNYAILPPNFLTDRTNPLTEIVEGRQVIPTGPTVTTTGPAVNSNTSDNDIAGGVSINRMALAPVGYGDYLNFAMRDAAFYAPKEVYRNQRTVDNARALRQMTNDSKHREMVEQQYNK